MTRTSKASVVAKIQAFWKKAKPFFILAILCLALLLLFDTMKAYRHHDLIKNLKSYSSITILTALALTTCNYFILTFYDVLAMKYVGKKLSYGKTAFTSFMSYVFSYNIGLSLFGSSTMRYRFYSLWGLDGEDIAKIVAFCVSTFWLGLATMGGCSLLFSASSSTVVLPFGFSSHVIGFLLVGAVLAYAGIALSGKVGLHIRSFSLEVPAFPIAAKQILVSSLDWFLAASVFYTLLPAEKPGFLPCLGIFVIAQLVGAVSHVPGGIGVFESMIMLSLSSSIPSDVLFGALIAYRAIYYLAPLLVGIIGFVLQEAYIQRKTLRTGATQTARVLAPFIPTVLSILVFIAGAVLIFSGATPAIKTRLMFLDPFIPLPLLEFSHFAASLTGLALLVIADALRRRIDGAYYLTIILLIVGAVLSLLKGFDWEEALVMGFVLLLLLPSRQLFYRHAAMLSPSSGLPWFIGVGTVFAVAIWLGLFSFKHIQYSSELWWVFEFKKDAPRALRAGLGLGISAAIISLRLLLSPVFKLTHRTYEKDRETLETIRKKGNRASAELSLLGDKYFFINESKNAFLMYGEINNMLVVMGDPIGEEQTFPDLLWTFYEQARRQGLRVVWYEISSSYLPVFVELGMHIFKLGEEAVVDLRTFTLEGSAGRNLRPPRNKMIREQYSFTVFSKEETTSHIQELRTISNAWLASKNAKEKGFSLGYFDEAYISQFPCAVVMKENTIVAFANLWSSGDAKELSVDLMRHLDEAPGGVMEYLFIECMLWGKEQGYEHFDLGMAPMSGLETRQGAPLWNKGVNFLFQNGEGIYNFQGLRSFKNKFNPNWTPVYLAVPSSVTTASLPIVAMNITQLVGKGKNIAISH
ncbi:bifunctional lysylphosphatidylglycerol flippase/synthetase MprF [uncultured Sphaerochaeta sp.]|uniref:bifunctional lysylphosphatidylglycerol flippase/synthetase MprF n=1 Tax=uncultured Sphaerochaeta sp. TaxID=886478 RepID=UPI002A0A419C|nr:bifunctional lysylphosphatidylglycerol flippase/synthetase MprF [uncultured Sphaerochaeta sp.]